MRRWLLPLVLVLLTGILWRGQSAAATVPNRPFTQVTTLEPADGRQATGFGQAVALDGDTLAVGAPWAPLGEEILLPLRGAVYIYTRAGDQWTLQQKVHATPGGWLDEFGAAVALDGNRLLVGAPMADGPAGADVGAAYLFEREDAQWSQQALLAPSNPEEKTFFGRAVGLAGATAIVGAPDATVGTTTRKGAAYIFTENSLGWSESATLFPSDAEENDRFASAIAVDGLLAAFGTPFFGGDDWPGAVHVYRRTLGGWKQGPTLTNDSIYNYRAQMGRAVDVDHATIAAGAPQAPSGGLLQGFAAAYVVGPLTWYEQGLLIPAESEGEDRLGTAVAVSGDTLLAGTPNAAVGNEQLALPYRGAVYHYRRLNGTWNLVERLVATPTGAEYDEFGAALALDGGTAVVGAPEVDLYGYESVGRVYIFEQVQPLYLPLVTTSH